MIGSRFTFALAGVITIGCAHGPSIPVEQIPRDADPEVQARIKQLYSDSAPDRAGAAKALGQLGVKAAPSIPFLTSLLEDREQAPGAAAPSCNHDLYGNTVGREAAVALGAIGERGINALIDVALNGRAERTRKNAIDALGERRVRSAVEPMTRILKSDARYTVREGIPGALRMIGDKSAIPVLVDALRRKEEIPNVHADVAMALFEFEDPGAIRHLVDLAKSGESELSRAQALHVLGLMSVWPNSVIPAAQKQLVLDTITSLSHGNDLVGREASRAVAYWSGKGSPIDLKATESVNTWECDRGDAHACVVVGRMNREGIGITRNDSKAGSYFKKGCDQGEASGCNSVGMMFAGGIVVAKSEERAIGYFKKACDGGHGNGCYNLGVMYSEGRGVPKDETQAGQLFKKACDGGDADGCYNLGALHANGQGVPKSLDDAATYFRKGCEGGLTKACKGLETTLNSRPQP